MRTYPEHNIQIQVVNYLRKFHPETLFSGGFSGEKINLLRAIRKKRLGYTAGTPDLIIFQPNNKNYHGLMIEFKSRTGSLSSEQKIFKEMAEARGYKYIVVKDVKEGIEQIENYLQEEKCRKQMK
jgi:hypothetical protein